LSLGKFSPSPKQTSGLWNRTAARLQSHNYIFCSQAPPFRALVHSFPTGWGQTPFPSRFKAPLLRGSVRQAHQATAALSPLRLTGISQHELLNVRHSEYDRHILKCNYCPLTDTYFQCKFKNRTSCHQLILRDAELPGFTLISSASASSDWQPGDLCLSEVPSLHHFPFFQARFPKCLADLISVKSGQDKVSAFLTLQVKTNKCNIRNLMKRRLPFDKNNSERGKKSADPYDSRLSKLFWWIQICGIRVKKTIGLLSGRNYKCEWTRNFTQALTLANIWLICEKKIIPVDINTWRVQFYTSCGTCTYLTQSKKGTSTSKSKFFRNPINVIIRLPQKQTNTSADTSGITT